MGVEFKAKLCNTVDRHILFSKSRRWSEDGQLDVIKADNDD